MKSARRLKLKETGKKTQKSGEKASSTKDVATYASSTRVNQSLLEHHKLQWLLGEWKTLVNGELKAIEQDPYRAELSLLIAAAHIQLGDLVSGKQFAQLAKQGGCSKQRISEVLVAGVYHTLGQAFATIDSQSPTAETHFENAIKTINIADREAAFTEVKHKFTDRKISSNSAFVPLITFDCQSESRPFSPTEIGGRKVQEKSMDYGGHTFNFSYRPDSVGDVGVIKQIFVEKQYEFGWLPQGKLIYALHNRLVKENKVPLIIDAGANIGASSIWFHLKFSRSTVLAIEPDLDNCELLRVNCAGENVLVFRGALADTNRTLQIHDPGNSDWGFRVMEDGQRNVNCTGIAEILEYLCDETCHPLILKIDIEGGEALAFKGECDWLALIPMIIIELHDWMLPGERSSENFLKAISRHNFEIITRGENVFCFNLNILNQQI
jgi:FkbM family methyltransferase